MKLTACPSIDMIRKTIKSFETNGKELPLVVAQNLIRNELDVWKPPVPNKASKIVIERDGQGPDYPIRREYARYARARRPPTIPVPNEIFCDILRLGDRGRCFSYKLNSGTFIRDRYMSKAFFRSMRFGYVTGLFAYCGIGNDLSLSVKEVY
jgi:hypothetical protein